MSGKRHTPVLLGAVFSVVVHGTVVLLLFNVPPPPVATAVPVEIVVWGEPAANPEFEDLSQPVGRTPSPDPIVIPAGGPESAQNISSADHGGGGDGVGAAQVILLTDRAHPVTLLDAPYNAEDQSQTQRIRTARDRATQEDRRSTPNPNDQPFLASGEGAIRERRSLSPQVPSAGVPTRQQAAHAGNDGSPSRAAGDTLAQTSDGARGSTPSPSPGVVESTGAVATARAPSAHGRPPVDEGPSATPAEHFQGPVRDSHNAELLAASLTQSMVEASQRSARREGEGAGGLSAPGDQGSGSGSGSGTASPHLPGSGSRGGLDTNSARYRTWHLAMRREVERRLRFPRARALAMDQGVSIYSFRVRQNGSLVATPQVNRSSNFPDLDQAGRQAIELAAPFPPLPEELGVPHTVSLRIEHRNPMVQ